MDIRYLQDSSGNEFFPVSHEKGVVDDSGTTLTTKLGLKANAADVYAKSDTYTKSEVNNLITTPESNIIIGALPASGVANTIYRVPGTGSYEDYGWDGTQFVKLATYTGSYDAGGALS